MAHFLTYPEAAVEVANHLIRHDAHGYSQPNRAGDGTVETIRLSDGTKAKVHGGDYDCSELVRTCWAAVGVLPWDYSQSYMWTGNEESVLTSHGFAVVPVRPASYMMPGDVLWRDGHTELYLGGGRCGGARHGDAPGGLTGRKGDQDGTEVNSGTYLPKSWTKAFRYSGPVRKPRQDPGKAFNDAGLRYRAHVERAGWLPAVRDGQTAGTTGQSARLEALKITPPEGLVLDVQAHVQRRGNMLYENIRRGRSSGTGSSASDPIIGTVGLGLRLEGIWVRVRENATGRELVYRAHVQGAGWLPWQTAREGRFGGLAGTTGQGLRMEALQMRLV